MASTNRSGSLRFARRLQTEWKSNFFWSQLVKWREHLYQTANPNPSQRFPILFWEWSRGYNQWTIFISPGNWFSRYLAKEKESRNIEAITAGELDTHLASSWQFANKMAASRQTFLRCKEALLQRYLGEQKSQSNILKDNEFKQCRRSCLMAKSAEHQQLQDSINTTKACHVLSVFRPTDHWTFSRINR